MKVYGQLERAGAEVLSSNPSAGTLGRFWYNSTDNKFFVDKSTNNRPFLLNDDKAIIGNSGTAADNIRLHRGAAGVLQFLQGGDATAEGSMSTSLNQLSFKFESYTDAGKPAFGQAGRVAYITDLAKLYLDTGSAWSAVLTSESAAVKDSVFFLQDDADPTKQVTFQVSGVLTGTTRTMTIPDESGTLQLKKLTTKGDLLTYSTTDTRLAVGTNNYLLYADSTAAEGVAWKNPDIQPEGISALTMGGAVTVDWSLASYFTGQMTGNSTFSFSNVANGRTITLVIQGHASVDYTITFPTMVKQTTFTGLVKTGKYNVYTITRSGGTLFASCVEDMV